MKKIPSLFVRDHATGKITEAVSPGAEWVIAGEGVATKKYDGTCCLVRDGKLYKRYEVKAGKTPPANFEPACEVDDVTGKQQGWVPVGDGAEDQYHREAFARGVSSGAIPLRDGTYELCGPKIQGNPEGYDRHWLVSHSTDAAELERQPHRTFADIREYLSTADIEGIVWHHPDGRMCKVKGKDFGIKRVRVGAAVMAT